MVAGWTSLLIDTRIRDQLSNVRLCCNISFFTLSTRGSGTRGRRFHWAGLINRRTTD